MNAFRSPLRMDFIVQRQLETLTTGNNAYLAIFLRVVKVAGVSVRIVFSPERSFGNRPFMSIHPAFLDLVDHVHVARSLKIGLRYWSLSPIVWTRFIKRLVIAGLQKSGRTIRIHSYLGNALERSEARRVAASVKKARPDMVVAEYSSLAPLLADLIEIPHRGVLLHDLFSLRALAFRESGTPYDFEAITLKDEAERCGAATVHFYASKNELAALAPLLPASKAIWIAPEPVHYRVDPHPKPVRAVFLGTRHGGNLDAVQHLLNDIWPRVLKLNPEARLDIAGSICADVSPEQAALPGVTLLGRVENLVEVSGADAIGLAPTRLASGVSIKVAEYLMLGMPSLVYPVALEGFHDSLDGLVRVTEGPDAFAQALVNLMDDHAARRAMSEQGLAQTPQRLSNQALKTYFETLRR